MGFEIYIVIWIVCGIGSYMIARDRGATNPLTWFLVGVLFGPSGIIFAAIGAKGRGQAVPVSAEELGRYAELRDRGAITNEEYEVQKARLLGVAGPSKGGAQPTNAVLGVIAIVVVVGGVMLYGTMQSQVEGILETVGRSV